MTTRIKYPRTSHLPWSPGFTSDDLRLVDIENFVGRNIVVTEKMDGENSTLYNNYLHARSLDSRSHESRDWLTRFQSEIGHNIPEGWRVCGENLFAQHAIRYEELSSYFYGFSIWNDENVCLSWPETIEWFELIGVTPVRVLYQGEFNEDLLRNIELDLTKQEGYVVRLEDSFHYSDFGSSVAKWVRKGHVTENDGHWFFKTVIKNLIKV